MNRLEKVERLPRFRTKLFVGMVLLVVTLTGLGLFLAQHEVTSEATMSRQRDFQNELADLHHVQDLRSAALTERCRNLAQRPRIHAALEDNALDVLYLCARDELQETMRREDGTGSASLASSLKAKFYRFLDGQGRVITPPDGVGAGQLTPSEEARVSLPRLSETQQLGYLVRKEGNGTTIDEVVAFPIVSMETGELIAALVLGFEPDSTDMTHNAEMTQNGIFVQGHLKIPGLPGTAVDQLTDEMKHITISPQQGGRSMLVTLAGEPQLLFYEQINQDSLYAPAYKVAIYSLADSLAQERRLRFQVLMAGGLLLVAGLLVSQFLAARLSTPVEKLEVDSRENWDQRQRAEAALQMTSAELQRAARFSADASHQLKTPLAVMRAGLEEIVAQNDLRPELREEVSALVHQTFRLSTIVDDLLLLSQMEAGRLQVSSESIDIMGIIEALVDDLTTLPDPLKVQIEQNSPNLFVAGEKRYITLILQNLFENARKYNCPDGEIRITCRPEDEFAVIVIGNTGRPIPVEARKNIFERFHRGTAGGNIPGHGLGLNLARELARLHGGDLRLKCSDENWTEFEVRFRLYRPGLGPLIGSPSRTN